MNRFAGKNVVVTGGNSGIGLATARAFAAEGARVALVARNAEGLAKAVAEIGGSAIAVQGDLSSIAGIDAAIAQVEAAFGHVDILFANAGTGAMVPFDQITEELWDKVMNTNVKGSFFTAQRCAALMPEGGAIILCSSISALRVWPGASIYAASKAAINSMGRSMAGELVKRGIRVNVIMPGGIDTPIMTHTPGVPPEAAGAIFEQMAAGTPMGRIGQPGEVAATVLFLASSAASYITGAELTIDGGVVGAT